jgi:hypothetical protein
LPGARGGGSVDVELQTIENKAESLGDALAGFEEARANADALSGQILPAGAEVGPENSAMRAEMREMRAAIVTQLRDEVARMHAHAMALFQCFRGEAISRLRDIQDRLPRNPR